MEKWLEINGRKILTRTLITELDWSFKGIVPQRIDYRDTYMDACQMLYGVQLATDAYRDGSTEIDDRLASDITKELLTVPKDIRLPEAIEILYNEMCEKIRLSDEQSSKWLDHCQKCSEMKMKEIMEGEKKEEERKNKVKSMELKDNENANHVMQLMKLLAAKKDSVGYELSQREISVTRLWCDLLIESLTSEYMSCGTMNYAVQSGIIGSGKMSDLIAESKIEYKPGKYKDYDWYSQDFMGDWPGTETEIKIKDFFHMFKDDLTEVIKGKKQKI